MSMTERMIIDLPVEQAQAVRAKVERGEYSNESEVISANLAIDEDSYESSEEVEHWLRTEVAEIYDRHKDNPSEFLTVDQLQVVRSRQTDSPT